MPTTTNLALPYPVATDTADVPRDIQALAAKLDTYTSLRPPVVTAMPASPAAGDEVYFQPLPANPDNAHVLWQLRFTTTTGWVFVGGDPVCLDAGTVTWDSSAGVWVNVGAVDFVTTNYGTTGDWIFRPSARAYSPGANANLGIAYYVDTVDSAAQHYTRAAVGFVAPVTTAISLERSFMRRGVAKNAHIKLSIVSSNVGPAPFAETRIYITPRVLRP